MVFLGMTKMSLLCVFSPKAEQMMKRIGVEGVKLTEYEMNIASHLVDPLSMKVTDGPYCFLPLDFMV